MPCTLCAHHATLFHTDSKSGVQTYICPQCDLRFIDPAWHLDETDEKKRYETHNNDISDPRYQAFVRPALDWIRNHLPKTARGLDYGCGEGPVLAHLLYAQGYDVTLYDPYFAPNPEALKKTYDYVVAIEVVEHFYKPAEEFARLSSLIRPDGALVIMTSLYSENTDFESWYYRRDPTHVCFYSKQTLSVICERLGFKSVDTFNDRLVCFRR